MKFSYNGADVYEISADKEKCIKHDIPASVYDADMKRRAVWVVQNLFNKSLLYMKRALESEWETLGVTALPPTDSELAALIVEKVPPAQSYQASVLAVDGVDLYTVPLVTKQLIDVATGRNADEVIAKGIANLFEEKVKMCCRRIREQYEPLMKAEKKSIPVSAQAFVQEAFLRSDYKDREARDVLTAADKAVMVEKTNSLLSTMLKV